MGMHPAIPPPLAQPPKKKTPVWVWVLAGVGGLLALVVVLVMAAGLFVMNKVADLAQNPKELGKIIAQVNPDLEYIDSDPEKKTLRVRDKKEGTTLTITLDDIMQGKLSVVREGKDGVETVEIGGKTKLPNWVPKFPDVEPKSLGTAQSAKEGEGGIFTFTTNVSKEKIVAFYRDGFEKRGLTMKADVAKGAALVMHSEEDGLHATINVAEDGGESRVTVAYGEKHK